MIAFKNLQTNIFEFITQNQAKITMQKKTTQQKINTFFFKRTLSKCTMLLV